MNHAPDIRTVPYQNGLLAALADNNLAISEALLEPVELEARQVLFRPHVPISAVYFLESGVVSLFARLERGGAIEIGVIGPEGMVGLPVALGVSSSPHEALVQVKSRAFRINVDDFRQELQRNSAVLSSMLRFECAFQSQVAQTAACNGRHVLEQRLARWLLMVRDRLNTDDLPLTQELLSTVLGVRRASVTTAVGILQRAGVIELTRGHVLVLDPNGLKRTACECYESVRWEYLQVHCA